MNPVMIWAAELNDALSEAINQGAATDLNEKYNPSYKGTAAEVNLSTEVLNLFKFANGFEITWRALDESQGGGRFHCVAVENMVQNWEGILFQPDLTEEEERIRNFKTFDLITNEAQCGVLLFPSGEDLEIYYNETGYNRIYGLDVDFTGYFEMALAARVYYYWPKVLLDIQSGEESQETIDFKENMPKIFPEFSWEEFVNTYESLRLSKQ